DAALFPRRGLVLALALALALALGLAFVGGRAIGALERRLGHVALVLGHAHAELRRLEILGRRLGRELGGLEVRLGERALLREGSDALEVALGELRRRLRARHRGRRLPGRSFRRLGARGQLAALPRIEQRWCDRLDRREGRAVVD